MRISPIKRNAYFQGELVGYEEPNYPQTPNINPIVPSFKCAPDEVDLEEEVYNVAIDILAGKYGQGEKLRAALKSGNYDYDTVMKKVRELSSDYEFAVDFMSGNYLEYGIPLSGTIVKRSRSKQVQNIIKRLEANSKKADDSELQIKLSKLSKDLVSNADYLRNNYAQYGFRNGDWCAKYITAVYSNTKVSETKSAYDIAELGECENNASTGYLMKHFLNENNENIKFYYNDRIDNYKDYNGKNYNYIPRPGDYVFFDWQGEKWTLSSNTQDHTGMVKELLKDEKGNVIGFKTIEGNISSGTNGFYEREIKFSDDDKILPLVIGYGTIENIPE